MTYANVTNTGRGQRGPGAVTPTGSYNVYTTCGDCKCMVGSYEEGLRGPLEVHICCTNSPKAPLTV